MIIRKQQCTLFSQHQEHAFELRLECFLRQQFPAVAAVQTDKLRCEIGTQTQKSRQYGMETETGIAAYVITSWLLGVDFDTQFPAAQEVLTAQIPGEMKAAFLERWTQQMFGEMDKA